MTIRYQDERITCDADGITIRLYYFPWGDKRVLYQAIKNVERYDMGSGVFRGRYRIWGGDHRYWFNYDPERPKKRHGLIVDKGDKPRIVLTPDDPEAVAKILEEEGFTITPSDA